jgi:hypothetical protein
MARQLKPDFERYMTALHCDEPDRAPLGGLVCGNEKHHCCTGRGRPPKFR